jgi:DNA polymerase-1
MSVNKRVLIVDMNNLFVRCYTVDPSLASDGNPIGGLKGSIKSLQKMIKEVMPTQIVCVWDGDGGSIKRKGLVKGYKGGRKPIKVNRFVNVLTDDENLQNKVFQMGRLIEYLNVMPLIQLKFDNTEADDIIAFLARHPFYTEYQKVIASSDKDFFQLCNNSTLISRPTSKKAKEGKKIGKEIITTKSLLEDPGIHPNNFAIARALAGDKSDNLPGVGGVGLKTAAKRFPFLREEKQATIKEVLEHAKSELTLSKRALKCYKSTVDNQDILRLNYKMMQLYVPSVGLGSKTMIKETLENIEFAWSKTNLLKLMIADGFGDLNMQSMHAAFNKITLGQ